MSEHTPGPWHLFAEADARLIAAAPELLAACEAAIRYDDCILGHAANGDYNLLQDGRAAIAKARGVQQP